MPGNKMQQAAPAAPAAGVMQRLGDAIAGVDRETAFQEGAYTRSQTDAAIELARQRRAEAEAQMMMNDARERVRGMDPATMYESGMGDIVAGELGSSYSGAALGRLRQEESDYRGTIADPLEPDDYRIAAAQAVSPARLSGAGLGDEIAYEIVQGEDGNPILVPEPEAAYRTPMSRLNPAANRSGSGSGGDGLFESADTGAIRSATADFFGGTYDPLTGRIAGLNRQQGQQALTIISRASQLFGSREASDHGTAVAMAIQELYPEQSDFDQRIFDQRIGDDVATGSRAAPSSGLEPDAGAGGDDDWQEGDVVVNPTTGQRLRLQGGQWVPAE